MDRAVSLSTDASTKSSSSRVSTGPDPTWVLESRVGQPADESWPVDRWPPDWWSADRWPTDWWLIDWWSADGWSND